MNPRIFALLLAITVPLPCRGADSPEFAVDVMALLSKSGCNAGTCHGNLNGKGGFKLSLRGEDALFDHHALVHASRGRRINSTAPRQSLFLQKATGQLAHRGGMRFKVGSESYKTLLAWLEAGAKGPSSHAPHVTKLDVAPSQVIQFDPAQSVSVHVTAHYSDGTIETVTNRACYELSNLNADVDSRGTVSRKQFGETTLVVRYLQQQVAVPIAFLAANEDFRWNNPAVHNVIDTHVFNKLRRMRMNPSEICDDSVFVRRAYLDAIGRLPTEPEAKRFVHNPRPDKRSNLIDQLLARPEFADYWALKWADVLRTEEKVLDEQGVEIFHRWIRHNILDAVPINQFVNELVTGSGSTYKEPAANYYRANRTPSVRGETTARLFLGTRLQCAKCHNHPFDRWTQDDYYGWSSLFSQIDYDLGENKRKDKLDKNEFVGEQVVLIKKKDEVRNPNTGLIAKPKFLGGQIVDLSGESNRLERLGQWLTSPNNDRFAKSQANFVWYHLMGQGLVDPIDDFRQTNPASNPALLESLATELVSNEFDLRHLVRLIMNSRTYQLSSIPNKSNQNDHSSYSHSIIRRLGAEVILDMHSDTLGLPATFAGYDQGIRAVQIPGVQRKRLRDQAPANGDRFLKTFGKPERILACDCERSDETTLKQAFTLIGQQLNDRLIQHDNRLNQWIDSEMSHSEIVESMYWTILTRPPNEHERLTALKIIESAGNDAKPVIQDLAWALLNAKEFIFRR